MAESFLDKLPSFSTLIRLVLLTGFALLPASGDLYLLNQFSMLMIYGMFAMSLSLVWGHAGLLCFGQAVFFGMGAYIMALISKGMVPGLSGFLAGSAMALILAVTSTFCFAWILGMFLFSGRLSGPYLGIVTLAISVLAERIAVNWYYIGGYNGLTSVPFLKFFGWELMDPTYLYFFVLLICLLVYILLRRVVASPFGAVLAATRNNEPRAESFGFNTVNFKIKAFAIGAAVAALAGSLFAVVAEFVSPIELGFKTSTEVLIWVAVGGRENLLAAFLGAVSVRLLEGYLSDWLGEYWLLALGVFFVICVVYFPKGLFGKVLVEKPKD